MDLNVTVRTGLSRFVMIDRILETDDTRILAEKAVSGPETAMFSGIEMLAQTGAFHVRRLLDFRRHAFLLGVRSYAGPCRLSPGIYSVSGKLLGQSREAFEYHLTGQGPDHSRLEGLFLFSARDYDENFSQTNLEDHYRNLFRCLTNDTSKNSNTSV